MTVQLTTTTELLAALHRGPDEPAWDVFVERYRPTLIGVARKLGLGPEDALDVAQQTLFEFVRDFRANRFERQRGRLRHWILGILQHRVHDLHRLRARETHHARTVSDQPKDDSAQMEEFWQQQIQRQILEEAIRVLRDDTKVSERSFRAFELTALREVPLEAAAAECGLTVESVYVARSRLAARLKGIVASLESAYSED